MWPSQATAGSVCGLGLPVLRRERELLARVAAATMEAQDGRTAGMSGVNISEFSALELVDEIVTRRLSPIDIIEHSLTRIERLNPSVNAIVWLRAAGATRDAQIAAARLASGEPARALEGVPFTVKDLCATEDGMQQMGSRAFAGHRPGVDAEVVRRLKHAGAILVGTTASSEFGNRPTTENALYGITRNPWNLERTSGGSSGGAGVSAALNLVPLNHGSDGGGSLRIPASCCGVFGFKPSRARISLAPLMSEEWGGLDVYGPITRTVADAAAFLDATAGPHRGDPYWAPPPERAFTDGVRDARPLRIAVAYERDGETVDPETIETVRATAEVLRSLGHQVVEAAPNLLPLEPAFVLVSTVGIGAMDLTDDQRERIEPRTRLIFDAAGHVRAVDYVRMLNRMHRECREMLRFFDEFDVLLTPTLSRPAPLIGSIAATIETAWDDYRNWLCWTWPFNVSGQPAASVPAGFSADGLPIGVQIVGRPADEHTVLAVAAQLERVRPWNLRTPAMW